MFKQISTSEGNNLTDNYISSHRTTEISDKLLLLIIIIIIIISESKVHPVTCHESTEGEIAAKFYSFFDLGANIRRWLTPRPGRFSPPLE